MSASLRVGSSLGEGAAKADACPNAPALATPTLDADAASTSPTSSDTLFPVVDLAPLLPPDDAAAASDPLLLLPSPAALAASRAIAASLVATGCVLVRDPRVSEKDNAGFLDLLERYFEQPEAAKRGDARPELHYQVGATPEGVERPSMLREGSNSAARAQSLVDKIKGLEEKEKEEKKEGPSSSSRHFPTWPRGADPKWRFFWRVGPRPAETAFPELNSPQVVPAAFAEEWAPTLDG